MPRRALRQAERAEDSSDGCRACRGLADGNGISPDPFTREESPIGLARPAPQGFLVTGDRSSAVVAQVLVEMAEKLPRQTIIRVETHHLFQMAHGLPHGALIVVDLGQATVGRQVFGPVVQDEMEVSCRFVQVAEL